MTNKTLYNERSELAKIKLQWHKLSGLHDRSEWSAAVVRSATAAELAANFAIRKEFELQSELSSSFVDSLLLWANGLSGKFDKLLIPMLREKDYFELISGLRSHVTTINTKRNKIVHSGEFCSEDVAKELIRKAKHFVVTIVSCYDSNFELPESD